nr:gamma-secretase-activating protein isoform X2 [Chlorocebus sabaeus]
MALRLVADFDLGKDVLPWLRAQRAASEASGAGSGGADVLENDYESLRVLNVERNGNIIYTYKDDKGNVIFGLYDCQTRQNELLYTFEKDLQVFSCSVNRERTLLAASLVQSTKEGKRNELQPGFHTLHTILGVHCLPLHNLLHCIDSGVLLLTETAVVRLMKDLDNTEKNEKLKFSIILRLPPLIGQKICRLWDHPMSSNIISRNHVTRLLQNYKKQPRNSMIDKSSFSVEFLPLNYFIEILTDIESSNQGCYRDQDN